jgi:PAS domain S-box-containing protein
VSRTSGDQATRPVQARLALAAVALLVAVVAILGVSQVISTRNSRSSQIADSELTAARLASSALSSALESRLSLVTNLTSVPGFGAIFAPAGAKELPKLATSLHLLYPGFASFAIIAGNGKLEARWPSDPSAIGSDVSSSTFFSHVMRTGDAYVSAATQQTAAPRELVVALAAPVRSGSKVVGMLVGALSASTLGSIIGGTGLRGGGGLVIVDQDGHALSGPAAGAAQAFAQLTSVSSPLEGHTGTMTGRAPGYVGTRPLAYAPVPGGFGWGVIAEFPAQTLQGPLTSLTLRLVVIFLLLLLLAIGTAVLIASLLGRLNRERTRTGAVLASVGEGVATLDESGRTRTLNPAMERILGVAARDVVGQPWAAAAAMCDNDGTPIPWEETVPFRAIEEHRVVATVGYEQELVCGDGRRLPVALTAAPLLAGDERLGAVVVLRDVSREREVDLLKSSLVSTVSHELRTPLTMIQGFSELLLSRDDLDEKRSREALEQVHSSSQRLARLIDDLLSVSRLDSGKIEVAFDPVDLGDAVAEALRTFQSEPAGRIVASIPDNLSPVLADRDKTVQVATNLVSNAVKYSPADSMVRVSISTGGDELVLSVQDSGSGLSEDEISHVFEKFTRLDRPDVRRVGGTGLGLYITKRLVAIQNGRIWVSSLPGHGSTFSVALPLARVVPERPSADEPRGELEKAIDR